MSGKGSKPRPFSVSQEHYASEWDRIFKRGAVYSPEDNAPLGDTRCGYYDALAGDGDTFEEKVSLSDEMQLHGEKHKPEHKP